MQKAKAMTKRALSLLLCAAMVMSFTYTRFADLVVSAADTLVPTMESTSYNSAAPTNQNKVIVADGSSRMEMTSDKLGLAFRYTISADGISVKDSTVADLTNATILVNGNQHKLVSMGAILTNDEAVGAKGMTLADVDNKKVLAINAKYLCALEDHSASYAVRITNIPLANKSSLIYARAYYVIASEIEGETVETIFYDDTQAANYSEQYDEKFVYIGETEYTEANIVTLGELFTGTNVKDDKVEVSVVGAATYVPDSENWKNGTITFTGAGDVTITITDNFVCVPTEVTVTVNELGAGDKITAPVTPDDGKVPAGGITLTGDSVSAYIPAGVALKDGVTSLTLTVTLLKDTQSGITAGDDEVLIPVDVHIDGIAEDNTVPIIIDLGEVLPKALNMGNYHLFHVESNGTNAMTLVDSRDELTAHNTFTYDPITGAVSIAMCTFSEVALVADTENAWEGKFDYTWYDASKTELNIANADQLAAFGAIVGGMNGKTQDSFKDKTVKLLADINLGDKESENNPDLIFYPIGYNCSDGKYEKTGEAVTTGFYNFCGTFDGNGHTIANFYHNTWEMKGDNNYYDATLQYYRDGMGLFGKIYGGTVKNLTVSNFSSDGEYTTTGAIAAYADGAIFENIAITNCNPRVYNIGNGGIVGCVGWYAKEANLKTTFKNITVDNTNKISALWGSYDVACGGIVGQYYPISGQTSANKPANGGVHFDNCHVSAQMDVYNDVCGNYQYYAYRYAGMLIGSVRENVTIDGYVYPDMTGITAKDCTVHFGTWNDYYYCEFEKNGHPSYSGPDDYKFSRVPNSEIDTSNGKENATCIGHNHSEVEDNQAIYLPFNNLVTGYGWGVTTKVVGELEGVTILDRVEGKSYVKFINKFDNENFTYRVGNTGTVSLGSLFKKTSQLDDKGNEITIINSGVVASITKVDENSDVSGTFTADTSDWTKGTIQFSGTGLVKITIQDYNFCTPTELIVEVVEATNATSATSATSGNVVLLNDAGFSSLTVSGGYTLYGNGFTLTCGSDSYALDTGYAFVNLENGTLDNVQIVLPNFDHAVLYKENMTSSSNRSYTDDKGTTRYYNVKSGVMVSGNSQILNSRISGARAAVNVTGGNCLIDNSRIELGAVASLLVGAANSVTLRDTTLVQKPAASTHKDADGNSKTLMGFSVLVICNADGSSAEINLEGELTQNAWVSESDKQYVPSAGQSLVGNALKQTDYLHDIDGDGTKESLNLGITYMPAATNSKVGTTTITDNRTNKNDIPYDYATVSGAKVYSYENTNGTADPFKSESEYTPNKNSDIITVSYSDSQDGLTNDKSFDTNGWVYELHVDLDKLSNYALDFSKLSMVVNNKTITDYKVNGNTKPSTIAVIAGGTTYTLTATVDGKDYTAFFKVIGTETTKESPSLVASNYAAALLVGEAGSTFSKDTWHGAAPALEGIQIKYWSVAEKQYKTITLSDYTPTTAGKQNGTNTTWTYSPANGDFTLTLTGGQVHSSNKVDAIPVVCNNKLYFVSATTSGLVNYGNSARTIPVSYSFKDNNGGTELTFSHTWSIECPDKATAYDYSDFMNGTSKTFTIKSSNGNGCVTPDTLVTLADGTQKRIDQVTYADELLVWDFYTGKYTVTSSALIQNHGYAWNNVIKLTFSDGTVTKAVNVHGYFDATINEFVMITPDNAANYIGHKFVKADGDAYASVTLVDVVVSEEYIEAYSILSAYYYNFITDNMFSLTSPVIETNFFMPFVVGENMTFDAEMMAEDIERYGLYEYADFEGKIPYEVFEALNIKYLKVAVGKGLITYDQIIELLLSEGVIG